MAAWDDLTSPRRQWAWLLEIAGVTVRYWSGQAPPTTAVPGFAALDYTDVEAIAPRGVGAQRMSLDEAGGISSYGGVSVTLVSRGDRATSTDPVRQLGRVSRQGATAWTKLAETLQHDDAAPATVEVVDSLAAWPVTGGLYHFHVGQEMCTATGVAAGPNRFTGVTRAVARTRPQEHMYAPSRALQPVVTSEPVHWRTRRARLLAAPITGRALVAADYVEVIRGYIDRTPVLGRDGLSVALTIAPLTMVLSQSVGGESGSTYLTRGLHRFEPGVGDTFGVALHVEDSTVCNEQILAPGAGLGGPVPANTLPHQAMADLALATGHPRRLPMRANTPTAAGDQWDIVGYVGGYQVGAAFPATAAGIRWVNAKAWDVRTYQVTAGSPVLVSWPEDVLAALGDVTAWAPGVVTGADGLWADVVPIMRADGSPALRCKVNGDVPGAKILAEFRAAWNKGGEAGRDFFPGQGYGRNRHEVCHYGLQWAEPTDGRWYDPRTRGAFAEHDRTDRDISAGNWRRVLEIDAVRGHGDATTEFDIRGWALGFYQTGESAILADGLILPTSPAANQWVQIRWKEGGNELRQIVPISGTAAQDDGLGNTVGYRYAIAAGWRYRTRSFGDWASDERTEIRAAAAWDRATSADVALQIMLSGRGRGVNGPYDVLPFGANMDPGDVRESDFDLRTAVAVTDEWSSTLVDSTPMAEVVAPMWRSGGVALTMRRYRNVVGERTQQLTLASVGVETPEVVATITDADIVTAAGLASETEDKPYARYKISADYDPQSDEPRTVATYVDADAVAENGGDGGATFDLELRGLHTNDPADIVASALGLIDSIRARLGRPRRKYRLRLHAGWSLRLALGDVVELTAADAVDYDGTRGVSAARCRVTAMSVDYSAGTVEVELTSYGARTAGWAPAMMITAVPDAFTLTADSNVYTDTTDIDDEALQDSDYFAPSDLVSIVPAGNWAGRLSRTIVGVSGTTIALNPLGPALPGPLAQYVGQTVRPRPYDSTSASLRVYVYAADAAKTLGAAADPARDWA